MALLLKRAHRSEVDLADAEREAAQWLCDPTGEGLAGLALALVQAGAFVLEKGCSFVVFKAEYELRRTKVFGSREEGSLREWLVGVDASFDRLFAALEAYGVKSVAWLKRHIEECESAAEDWAAEAELVVSKMEKKTLERAVRRSPAVREERTVQTTRAMNMSALSDGARDVLKVLSLLHPSAMPQEVCGKALCRLAANGARGLSAAALKAGAHLGSASKSSKAAAPSRGGGAGVVVGV